MAGYQRLILMALKYGGKKLGPRALKAAGLAVPLLTELQKNPQVRKAIEQAQARITARGSKIQAQIDLGKEFATDALQEETAPERREIARTWVQRLKVQEMALRSSANMSRAAAKPKRDAIAAAVDEIVADIITTLGTWSEG